MNYKLLAPKVQDYIWEASESTTDIHRLLLSQSPFAGITAQELAQQISGRKKALKKLPTWSKTKQIYYPAGMGIAQASSEQTAAYKSQLVQAKPGAERLLDLTGGFGVDSYFFSKKMETVSYCEQNSDLLAIVKHNFEQLQSLNTEMYLGNCLDLLQSKSHFDWLYVDPSRRHAQKGRVFRLQDCSPNIPVHLDLLFQKSQNLLIKCSPMLDIDEGIRAFKNVKAVHVLAVRDEVKELIWELNREYSGEIQLHTINFLKTHSQEFDFTLEQESDAQSAYSDPMQYLYEPNAAIRKSGGFKILGPAFGLAKLQQHTHLYTADHLVSGFPGRIFSVQKQCKYNKRLGKELQLFKANITTRNFPETVHQLRKRWKIKEGGSDYLFFTTFGMNQKTVLVCQKINGN